MFYSAKRLCRTARIAFVLPCIFLGIAFAHAASRGPLTPSKVFINDDFVPVDLEPSRIVQVFPSTKVTCPAKHTKGCTIRLETALELEDVPTNGSVLEWVLTDGQMVSIIPLEPPAHTGFAYHIAPVFVLGNIQAGTTVTIDVQLQNLFDTARVHNRVETIELLLN